MIRRRIQWQEELGALQVIEALTAERAAGVTGGEPDIDAGFVEEVGAGELAQLRLFCNGFAFVSSLVLFLLFFLIPVGCFNGIEAENASVA